MVLRIMFRLFLVIAATKQIFNVRCRWLMWLLPLPSEMMMFCGYEHQAGFDDRYSDRRACSGLGWLLLLADGQSAFL